MLKKAEKRKTWAEPAPNEDDDSATNRILENQRHNINYTIRHGLKINQRAKKKDLYKTAGRKHQTCSGMPKSRWGEEDESKYEVKAHIRDTDTLLQTSEWDTLVGTGITHLVVEDHDNVLSVIPTHVAEIQTLRSLTIMWSKIKVIPEHVLQMSLHELFLQKCPIKDIPGIHRMEKLVKLEISNACIKKIPVEIGGMVKLKYLDLNGNRLKVLPVSIGNLRHLEILKVCANRLKALPETVTDLASMHTLDASQNHIKELPDDIGRLSNLVTLRMSHNQMDSLPESVQQLCSLRNMFISYNMFSEIPVVLCHMNELSTLNMVGNQIRGFSTPLPNLTTFLLDKNNIELLQVPLFGCVNLETLSLQFNKITSVPPEIKRLTKLRVLYLGGNDIKALPDEICELKELRHLVMRETAINELPKYLDTLRKLSVVDIDDTKLSMQYMHALRKDGVEGLLRHVGEKRNSGTISSSEGGERFEDDEDDDEDAVSRDLQSDESEPEAPPGGRTVTFRLPDKSERSKTMPANTSVPRKNIISLWPTDSDVPPLLRDSVLSDDGSVRVNAKRRQIKTMMPEDLRVDGVISSEPIAHQSLVWSDETKRDSTHRDTEAIEMTVHTKKPSSDSEEELSEISSDDATKESPAQKPAIQFDSKNINHHASFGTEGNDTDSGSDFEEIPERIENSPSKILLKSNPEKTNILRYKEATQNGPTGTTEQPSPLYSQDIKRGSVSKPPPAPKPDRLSSRLSADLTSQAQDQTSNGNNHQPTNTINLNTAHSETSNLIPGKDTGNVAHRQSAGDASEKRMSKPKPPVAEKPNRASVTTDDAFDDDDDEDPLASLKASLIGRDPRPAVNNRPQFHVPIIDTNLHDIKE